MLDRLRSDKKNQYEGHDEKYQAHGKRRIVRALGKLEQVTKTSSRCHKLANHGTRKANPTATLRLPSTQAVTDGI
jgi:hypothetical protein